MMTHASSLCYLCSEFPKQQKLQLSKNGDLSNCQGKQCQLQWFIFWHCMCLQRGLNPSCQHRLLTPYQLGYPLFCRKKGLESQLLFASRTVSSMYCRLEQEAAFPEWRTLESYTRLVLIHGARIQWWSGTHPTKLCNDQLKLQTYAVYAQYTEYAEYNLVSGDLCIPPALKHMHIRVSSFQHRSLYRLRKEEATCRTRYCRSSAETLGQRCLAAWWTHSLGDLTAASFWVQMAMKKCSSHPDVLYAQSEEWSKDNWVVLDFFRRRVSRSALFCAS